MIEQVKRIIAEELHIDPAEIADDADLIEDLGADSLSAVTIIMVAEDEYGIKIPDEMTATLRTPALIAAYVESLEK